MEYKIKVKWGDTDAAGIVFYPNFYKWMDEATHEFFNVIGFPTNQLFEENIGLPLVETHCEFERPLRFNTEVTVFTSIVFVKEKVFKLQHDFIGDDQLVATGYEVRAWAMIEGERAKAVPIPTHVAEQFQSHLKDK